MIRSLFAVIVAVIAGLGAARFVEGAVMAISGESAAALGASWTVGAFVATFLALLLGRRWAPLGVWSAFTIFFSALVTILTAKLSWLLAPMAALGVVIGGWLSLRIMKARFEYPKPSIDTEIFTDE